MSTRASVAWDEEGDSFHLYEELMDGRLWLEVRVCQFVAQGGENNRPGVLCFPVPHALLEKVFLEKYRKPPGDGGLFVFDLKKGGRQLLRSKRDVDRFLAKGERKSGRTRSRRRAASHPPPGRRRKGTGPRAPGAASTKGADAAPKA